MGLLYINKAENQLVVRSKIHLLMGNTNVVNLLTLNSLKGKDWHRKGLDIIDLKQVAVISATHLSQSRNNIVLPIRYILVRKNRCSTQSKVTLRVIALLPSANEVAER